MRYIKAIMVYVLVFSLILCSCGTIEKDEDTEKNQQNEKTEIKLDDNETIKAIEKAINEALAEWDGSDEYKIESIEAVYVSVDYIEELSYNSKSNIFFGYTLSELDEAYQNCRYEFTLGEDGKTTIIDVEEYAPGYSEEIKQIAVDGGFILIKIGVSVLSGKGSSTIVNLLFGATVKSGVSKILVTAVTGAVSTGITSDEFKKIMDSIGDNAVGAILDIFGKK